MNKIQWIYDDEDTGNNYLTARVNNNYLDIIYYKNSWTVFLNRKIIKDEFLKRDEAKSWVEKSQEFKQLMENSIEM